MILTSIFLLLNSHKNVIRVCDIYLRLNLNDFLAYNEKGKRLQKLARFEESIKCFKKALKAGQDEIGLDDHFLLLNNIGYSFEMLSNLDEAKNYYIRSIKIKSNYYSWSAIGRIEKLEENYEIALKNVNNSLKINKDDVYSNFEI